MAETAPQGTEGQQQQAGGAPGTGSSDSGAGNNGGGAPGNQNGQPTFATDKERADHFEQRHREATDMLRREGETKKQYETRLARYKETYGELEDDNGSGSQGGQDNGQKIDAASVGKLVDERFAAKELDNAINRTPSLVPHAQEIKDLVSTGKMKLEEAREIVAKRHNVTLGPTPDNIDFMPHMPGGGGIQSGSNFTAEQEEAMRADGIDPEKAKKHLPAVQKALRRVRR